MKRQLKSSGPISTEHLTVYATGLEMDMKQVILNA